jgi:hypothetical protein
MNTDNQITRSEIYKQLRTLGYTKPYITKVLPDWWSDELLGSNSGLAEFALFLKKRLGIVAQFESSNLVFSKSPFDVKFKKRAETEVSDLGLATSIGRAIGSLLAFGVEAQQDLPCSPSEIRTIIAKSDASGIVSFEGLVKFCWSVGIPVVFMTKKLPLGSKKPMGMAMNVKGRYVIILGKNDDRHATQLFILAHELGHIVKGHLQINEILADESIDQVNESLQDFQGVDHEEDEADEFAKELLRGQEERSSLAVYFGRKNISASLLASKAVQESIASKIDVGHLLLSYAYDSKNWATAISAFGYLSNTNGARDIVTANFKNHFLENSISKEDYRYLLEL